jgi:hypothetical protein
VAIQKIRLDQVVSSTVNYDSLGDQVEGMSVPFFQEFTATEGQTEFTLSTNYNMGSNSLKVYLNGIYQDLNVDYEETFANEVTFNSPLFSGDWVLFRIEGAGSGTTLETHIHVTRETPSGSINGSNAVFNLQYVPRENSEQIYKNGVLQTKGLTADYTINENAITFNSAPLSGARILVNYIV